MDGSNMGKSQVEAKSLMASLVSDQSSTIGLLCGLDKVRKINEVNRDLPAFDSAPPTTNMRMH